MTCRFRTKIFASFIKITNNQRASYSKEVANLLQYLDNGMLLNCGGKLVNAGKAFVDKKIIAYYFSASWCGPCKQLLPKLKEVYQKGIEYKSGLEIIYISSDTSADEMVKYFKERHGGWFAVPFEDNGGEMLRQIYEVTHVPKIIVVKEDGTIITRNGVQDVNELGVNVLVAWNASSV